MAIKFANTLTRHLDTFVPLQPGKVSLYTCGPTVYSYLHVGNWAAYIYWDILVRMLQAEGYEVERVMNITDVGHLTSDADEGEDKLEKGARREGKTAWQIAKFYADDFIRGMNALHLTLPSQLARATDYIDEQIQLAITLKRKGHTYQTSDGIYFDTSTFPAYADFARLDLRALRAGARIGPNSEKRHASDFALWKFSPTGVKRDMEWSTPSELLDQPPTDGAPVMGFPGWHLECSAIAMHFLGATLDIHTGGIDHIPVHHSNEIAQSEAATGQPFAHYWLHCNHLKVNGTKISKSLGNGYTLADLAERGYTPMEYKLFVLQSHYSHEGNFSWENLSAARNRLRKWYEVACLRHQTYESLDDDQRKSDEQSGHVSLLAASGAVREALANDLNTPEALRLIDEAFDRVLARPLAAVYHRGLEELLVAIDQLLGLDLCESTPDITDEAKQLILKRQRAREARDWPTADRLRTELATQHIAVRDTPQGPVWWWAEK